MQVRGQRAERARRVVVARLRAGDSVAAAARKAGIGRQTIYTWAERGDDEMRQILRDRRRGGGVRGALPKDLAPAPPDADAQAVARLTLEEIARDRNVPSTVRFKAAVELAKIKAPSSPAPNNSVVRSGAARVPKPKIKATKTSVDPTARFR